MASDDLKVHFHLTPRGWLAGTRWYFGKIQNKELPAPADALATFELHITQQSEWSKENRSWVESWRSESASPEQVEEAKKKFGQPNEDSKLPHD